VPAGTLAIGFQAVALVSLVSCRSMVKPSSLLALSV